MTTTAYHRKIAADLEIMCEWNRAAQHWQKALDLYPSTGALADLDKAKIAAKLEACIAMDNAESAQMEAK